MEVHLVLQKLLVEVGLARLRGLNSDVFARVQNHGLVRLGGRVEGPFPSLVLGVALDLLGEAVQVRLAFEHIIDLLLELCDLLLLARDDDPVVDHDSVRHDRRGLHLGQMRWSILQRERVLVLPKPNFSGPLLAGHDYAGARNGFGISLLQTAAHH